MYSQVSAGNFSQKSTSSWSCYIFDTLRIRMMHQVASNIRSRKEFGMGMGRNFNVIIPTGEVEPSLMFSSIATPKWRSICETKAAEIEMLLILFDEALSECAVQVSLSANINLSSATSYDLNINVKGTRPGDGMENHDSEEIIIRWNTKDSIRVKASRKLNQTNHLWWQRFPNQILLSVWAGHEFDVELCGAGLIGLQAEKVVEPAGEFWVFQVVVRRLIIHLLLRKIENSPFGHRKLDQ